MVVLGQGVLRQSKHGMKHTGADREVACEEEVMANKNGTTMGAPTEGRACTLVNR